MTVRQLKERLDAEIAAGGGEVLVCVMKLERGWRGSDEDRQCEVVNIAGPVSYDYAPSGTMRTFLLETD
jgi:hypothetical protein